MMQLLEMNCLSFFGVNQEDPNNEVPLVLWLQGGPGASSLIGLFLELGPFSVRNESNILNLKKNEYSWGKEFSLLFIDQPVGTGKRIDTQFHFILFITSVYLTDIIYFCILIPVAFGSERIYSSRQMK